MDLFGDVLPPAGRPRGARGKPPAQVDAAPVDADLQDLAARLPSRVHLGTSSWSFPGWKGLVWAGDHSDAQLSCAGLSAYARHPMLRTVSLDRSFYRPLTGSEYAAYAAQVPQDFRFIVKAPSLVCDALLRGADGRATQDNPAFLDPEIASREFVLPALEGLGSKIGALVFQLSPLPPRRLERMDLLLEQIAAMLAAVPALRSAAPDGVIAVEVRNRELLTPAFASVLKHAGATYCVGLHPKLPAIELQLPMVRALWPGPLVCRWSLNARHGAYGYAGAKLEYAPFDRLVDPDPGTRAALARVIAGTAGSGFPVYISVNNKAEGSAPLSVFALGQAVAQLDSAN